LTFDFGLPLDFELWALNSYTLAMPPAAYYGLGFVLLIACLMISKILRRKRQEQVGLFGSQTQTDSRAREELEHLIVQMQEVAREQIAKADGKIRMLNHLLQECDTKKKELETLLSKAPELPTRSTPPPQRPSNPLHDKVFSLQDKGLPLSQICRETGLEIGEVEMILGLRKLQGS
jgi:hypothetical protein